VFIFERNGGQASNEMKFLSICEVCLQSYYLDEDEAVVPANIRIIRKRSKTPYMETWGEWIAHVQTHCPVCRFECPQNALDDFNTKQAAREAENAEITKDDEIFDD